MAYATRQDIIDFGLKLEVVNGYSTESVDAHLANASSDMDFYFNAVGPVPLAVVPEIVRQKCVDIAVWNMKCQKGFKLQDTDEIYRLKYQDAIAWLKLIAQGIIPLPSAAFGSASSESVFRPRVIKAKY